MINKMIEVMSGGHIPPSYTCTLFVHIFVLQNFRFISSHRSILQTDCIYSATASHLCNVEYRARVVTSLQYTPAHAAPLTVATVLNLTLCSTFVSDYIKGQFHRHVVLDGAHMCIN